MLLKTLLKFSCDYNTFVVGVSCLLKWKTSHMGQNSFQCCLTKLKICWVQISTKTKCIYLQVESRDGKMDLLGPPKPNWPMYEFVCIRPRLT